MKTLFFSLCLTIGSFASAQVSFTVTAPASIAGGYNFTSNGDGTDWGLPNLLDPLDAVMDTLMLVDDGTPGINAQGIPFANEGCGTLVNNLAGKIAVVYRYDGVSANVCWYGTKVLMAEQAGAIGVVMINRDDALIDVPGTTDGPSTSIPFAFISKSDGAILRARMDAGEDVVAFIGNKTGLYANDAGIVNSSTSSPVISATSSQTSLDGSEFGFDLGTQIYNYGNTDQNTVSVTATVTGPAGTWNQTAGPFSIVAGDSIDVYTGGTNDLPAFSFANYPDGRYTLTYDVDLGIPDESDFDNSLSYDFVISDSLVAYCSLDPLTNLPIANSNYRPANSPGTYEMCMVYDNPNGSRLGAQGIYFSAVTGYNSGVFLDGEEVELTLYRWENVFTDLNDVNLAFDNLTPVAFGYYYYPSDLQGEMVFGEFVDAVQLQDNQRFLACVKPSNPEIYLGHDTRIDYTRSVSTTLQPYGPSSSDAGWFALGFGTDLSPSMALKVFDAAEVSVDDVEMIQGSVFPNPATVKISVHAGNESINSEIVLHDMTGRIISTQEYIPGSNNDILLSDLKPGQYLIKINYEDGFSEQHPITKL